MAEKTYRLRSGVMGTEYEWCAEQLKVLKTRQQQLEDEIEIMQLRMQTAEGHP